MKSVNENHNNKEIEELKLKKNVLLAKMQFINSLRERYDINISRNYKEQEKIAFYYGLYHEYEELEKEKDNTKNIFLKLKLLISLKMDEALFKKIFGNVDLDFLVMDEYNCIEKYKGILGQIEFNKIEMKRLESEYKNIVLEIEKVKSKK